MTAAKISIKSDKPKLTKRQKRKQVNESNTWQQQPKIKSMEARNKGYLRIAGFTKEGKPKTAINPDDDFINSPEYKFGRLLASPDARTRHATILKLKDYLRARTEPKNDNGGLSVLDLMKLWKGMWHTLYLCDGVAVQDEVSKHLSELLWSVGGTEEEDEYAGRVYLEMEEGDEYHECDDDDCCIEEDLDSNKSSGNNDYDEIEMMEMEESGNESEEDKIDLANIHPAADEELKHCRGAHLSALYIRAYFRTLTREWSNMDKYRIDKFYTLTRLLLREIYKYMKSRHWNLGIIRLFNDAIFEEVLRNTTYGNGVRFHMLDICLEELAKVNSDEKTAGLPLTEATFLDCLEPYFAMAQRVEESHVHSRVMEKVLSRFLNEYSVVSDKYEPKNQESEKNVLIMDQVHVGTVAQFIFELASDPETEDRYRKQLYDMHKMYMKRIRTVGRDVLLSDGFEENDDHIVEDDNVAFVVEDQLKDESISKEDIAKKSREKTLNTIIHNEDFVDTGSNLENVKTKTKKNYKKGKKDDLQKVSKVSLSKEEEEDTIVISYKEQKAAERAMKKAKRSSERKASKSRDEVHLKTELKKTVKFGTTNKSKSYKASIKDLKRIDANQTLLKTPEKSILLKKYV